ncbi:MAG: globin domain-containing protein [Sediminibacterium sp.]|nr:globin domain-containing protein [Sediminibacterium sp.]
MKDQQIQLVKKSWAKVSHDPQFLGALFYNHLFQVAPELRPYFVNNIEEQQVKLVKMIDYLVSHIDNLTIIEEQVKPLAKRHISYGTEPHHYQIIGKNLIWVLAQELGDEWNDKLEEAWKELYQTIANFMIKESQ